MATAKKLKSGNWRCLVYDYTDAKKKRHYESFTANSKKEAEFMAAEFAFNKQRRNKATITFGEAFDAYIEARNSVLSPASIRKYKSMRRSVLQDLMDIKLKDITQDRVQSAINSEAENHSPKSIRDMHGILSAVLKHNNVNLHLNTVLPKKVRPDIYIPLDGDILRLIEAAKDTVMEIPVYLAAFGTMRRGEISALESTDIEGNVVHISKTMVLNDDKEWITKAPKSYAGDRYIEFPDFVATKLADQYGNITGLTPNQITSRFSHLLKKAKLPAFRFHDLRHYSASISHALGVPDAYIMEMGGWEDDKVLKGVYRHAMDDKRRTVNKIIINHFNNLCNTKCNTKK